MYKLLAGAVGIALLVTGVGWFSYKAGINSEIASGVKIIAKYQEKERQVIKELEKTKKALEVKTREKLKTIREVADPTGCIDIDAPDSVLQQLTTSSTP